MLGRNVIFGERGTGKSIRNRVGCSRLDLVLVLVAVVCEEFEEKRGISVVEEWQSFGLYLFI